MIKADVAQRIKDDANSDIVRIIGAFVALKKAGSSHKGCCPFHNEKSPSFTVSPTRRNFKCFGCGKSGNAVDFVMEFKKLTYPEALEYLASELSIVLEYESVNRPQSRFTGINLR